MEMNKTTALTTATTKALANKKLCKQINVIVSGVLGVAKCNWQVAGALHTIMNDELWKDDFKTKKEFYEFLGFEEASAIQYCKAYEFMKNHGYLPEDAKGKVLYNDIPTTIGIAYLLSTLEKKGELNDFVTWLEGKTGTPELFDYTADALKKLIKEFRTKDSKEAEDSKETTTKTGSQIHSKEEALIVIYDLMVAFDITLEEIPEPEETKREKVKPVKESKSKGKGKGKEKK